MVVSKISPHPIFAPLQYWGGLEARGKDLKHFKCSDEK